MKIRSYEYFIVGVKYPLDKTFSLFMEPHERLEEAQTIAMKHVGKDAKYGREAAVFRVQMLRKYEPSHLEGEREKTRTDELDAMRGTY